MSRLSRPPSSHLVFNEKKISIFFPHPPYPLERVRKEKDLRVVSVQQRTFRITLGYHSLPKDGQTTRSGSSPSSTLVLHQSLTPSTRPGPTSHWYTGGETPCRRRKPRLSSWTCVPAYTWIEPPRRLNKFVYRPGLGSQRQTKYSDPPRTVKRKN